MWAGSKPGRLLIGSHRRKCACLDHAAMAPLDRPNEDLLMYSPDRPLLRFLSQHRAHLGHYWLAVVCLVSLALVPRGLAAQSPSDRAALEHFRDSLAAT